MSIRNLRLLSVRYPTLRHLLQLRPHLPGIPVLLKRLGLMAIIHSNGVPQKNPAKAAGLSLPNVESDLLQGALPIRLEVIGSTWRCLKQKRDVRVLLWEKAPQVLTASDLRSRPNIAASIRGWARIVALLPRIVVALSARTLSVSLRSRTPTV